MPSGLTIPVRLGPRSYEVQIGHRHWMRLGPAVRRLELGTHPILLTNPILQKSHAATVRRVLSKQGFPVEVLRVADTEQSKSLPALNRLLLQLAQLDGPGRRLFLVLVGGGVVGDLGGLAAGLYRRGIPYVQVPTTLLAQVDSSIGGKTGIDLPEGKNLVGLFHQPRLVFIELGFLDTLSDRQFRSGLAEVAKCGVIRDRTLFAFLEKTPVSTLRRNKGLLGWAVARAVKVKGSIVESDERETGGIRTLLNFGHTLGHAVEAATGYSKAYTHGEAIAVGMLAATELSLKLGILPKEEAARIRALIIHLGLPTRLRGVRLPALLRAMSHDKKWGFGENRWVLPTGIGQGVVRAGVPNSLIRQAIRNLQEA